MSAALYRDAFILHQPILISVAENAQTSPVRTGSYKNSAMVFSALLEPVLTVDFKCFATVISALLEPVLTGDFKSFETVISALLEPVLTGDLRHSSRHAGETVRASRESSCLCPESELAGDSTRTTGRSKYSQSYYVKSF